MSDNSIGRDCLVHYNNQHIQVRKDFFDLCAYDKSQYNTEKRKSGNTKRDEPNQECMAKILRLLETLTNRKKDQWFIDNERLIAKKQRPKREPEEYRIELAYSTIVKLLYSTYGESTVRNSITVLVQRDFVKRYQETKGSIPQYVLNIPVLQAALEGQIPEGEDEGVLNSTPPQEEPTRVLKTTGRGVNSTPPVLKTTATLLNSTPNNISPKKDSKKENNISPEHSSINEIEENEGREEPQPLMLGFAKMAMRDCLQYCGKSISDTYLLTRTDDILKRSRLDKQDFRVKVDSVLNDLRASGNRDIEAFFKRLEKVLQLEPVAQEG